METKDIEEIVEKFKQTNIYQTARVSGYGKKMEDWLRTTLTTLTTKHEADIEKAVEAERERIYGEVVALEINHDYEQGDYDQNLHHGGYSHALGIVKAIFTKKEEYIMPELYPWKDSFEALTPTKTDNQ